MSTKSTKISVPENWSFHPLIDDDRKALESCFSFLELSITSNDTRQTYRRALARLMSHCAEQGVEQLLDVEPSHIKAYVEGLKEDGKKAAAKSGYYSGKSFFQHCVDDGVLSINPAASVKVSFKKAKRGKTSVITPEDVNRIILSIPDMSNIETDPPKQTDMRDRALIAVMAYTFARIGGALSCRIRNFYFDDGNHWLDMTEKGGDEHEVPVPVAAAEMLQEYIAYCSLTDPDAWLFQSANRNGKLTGKPYDRSNSLTMVKRRAKDSLGCDVDIKNHTFRATGITTALNDGKSYELVQEMANHSDGDTTKLYDRSRRKRLAQAMKDFDYE